MKSLFICAILLLASSPSFATSWPIKLGLIDKTLAAGDAKNAERVRNLRDQGEQLHTSGDHSGSVAILEKAMKLGGIKN